MQENIELNKLPVVESDIRKVTFNEKLSDLIGERYKEWKKGEIVFVHASTGLGKTYATLKFWYEYAIEQEVEMAVLVNRRLVKEQQWKDIREHDLEMNRQKVKLHLFSYQNLEGSGEESAYKKKILKDCRYIVCDECHYFLADATFNPGVQRSFDYITSLYENATLIFLSATMTNIRPLIENRVYELHQEKLQKWKKHEQDYEEKIINDCLYYQDGSERGLCAFGDRLEQKRQSLEYEYNKAFYKRMMSLPAVKEYQFLRDISGNIEVKYFHDMKQVLKLITLGTYLGKWLIFVASKKVGKEIRDELMEKLHDKKIVYIDAEYDEVSVNNLYQKETQTEVHNIVKTGLFKCDILITTAVLDNGVNIKDSRVKNIVLMTENEDEFKQMLGRRRILDNSEKLNLFLCVGNIGTFSKRASLYYKIYWELCDNRDISASKLHELLLDNPKKLSNLLSSYYDFSSGRYHSNELAIKAVRLLYLYCYKVLKGLENDEHFFIKEQLGWLGKSYTQEWANYADVGFSKTEVDEIRNSLDDLYCIGVLDEQTFKEFGQELMKVASKIDSKKFLDKTGSITSVNSALQIREEWSNYEIVSIGDRTAYYEILLDGKARNRIHAEITQQRLEEIVKEAQTDDIGVIYDKLFENDIPTCFINNSKDLMVFINNKLKNYPGLEDRILKSSGKGDIKKIIVGKRPNSINGKSKKYINDMTDKEAATWKKE